MPNKEVNERELHDRLRVGFSQVLEPMATTSLSTHQASDCSVLCVYNDLSLFKMSSDGLKYGAVRKEASLPNTGNSKSDRTVVAEVRKSVEAKWSFQRCQLLKNTSLEKGTTNAHHN